MDELDELDSIIDSISVNEPTPSDYVGSGDEDLEDILNDLANAEPAAYTPAPAPAPAPATTTTTTNTSTTTSSTSAPRVSTLDFGIDDLETASASKPTITPARKPTTTTNTTNTTTTSAYVSDPRISSLDFGIDLASSSSAPKSSPSASAPTQSFVATTKSNVSTTTPKPAPTTSTNVTPSATAGDDDLDNILSDLQDPSKKAKPSGPHPNAARGNRNCGKCGLNVALTERATEVEGIVYHSTCFTCTDCHAAITGTFLIIDGHPKCDACAQKNKCAACNMALDGTILQQPDGSRKHARCANVSSCGKCGGALSSGSIVTAGEQKYHERCFVCTGCNAPLTQYVRVDGQNYCQPCGNKKTLPTCSVCRSQINGEYFQRNGQPLCVPCSKK